MYRLLRIRLIPVAVAASYLMSVCPASLVPRAVAQATSPEQTRKAGDPLDVARELIKAGDYDRAIEVLKAAMAGGRGEPTGRRDAYLLLIKSYVFLGNDLKFKPQGREASSLNYRAAREMIAECLGVKELRHTRPEPVSEYPPEMISAFIEVRGQVLGAFRVAGLEPPHAVVLFDGDTLRARPAEVMPGEVDLPVGRHQVVVQAPGYRTVTDEISISPNSTLERSYQLKRRRSRAWYATVATGAVGVVGGLIALAVGGGRKSASAEPLPDPPPPPSQ